MLRVQRSHSRCDIVCWYSGFGGGDISARVTCSRASPRLGIRVAELKYTSILRRLTLKVLADASSATSMVSWESLERLLKVVTEATVLAAYGSPVTRKLTCGP